ncbi:MAG: thioredoxin family protein [Bacteroidota bacterium]
MTKFGELIDSNIPILIDFYKDMGGKKSNLHSVLRDVALALGENARVLKIDVDKNETLARALRIKRNPTFVIYKDGEMKWRETGIQDANTLIGLVEQYV